MEITKQQIEEAILFFAKKYGQEKGFKILLSEYLTMPKIVEMIVYQMFLNKFDLSTSTDEEFEHCTILHLYALELNKNGFFKFKKTG